MAPFEWQRFCPRKLRCRTVPCRPPWGNLRSCKAMAEYAKSSGLQFLGRETVLEEVHAKDAFELCSQFRYIMLFKDPMRRLQSNLNRLASRPNKQAKAWLTRLVFTEHRTSDLAGTPSLNNFVARTILGTDAFFLPPGGINASHEQAATVMLSKFALVLPVERLSEVYAQNRIALLFGYNTTATESTRKLQHLLSQKRNHRSRKQRLNPVTVSLLTRMNVIDMSLYRQTLAKYESDKLVFEKRVADY